MVVVIKGGERWWRCRLGLGLPRMLCAAVVQAIGDAEFADVQLCLDAALFVESTVNSRGHS